MNEISGQYVASAVTNFIDGIHSYAKENLHFDNTVYFNSGVMLIKIYKWEKNGFTLKNINMVNNGAIYKFADQDVLNIHSSTKKIRSLIAFESNR